MPWISLLVIVPFVAAIALAFVPRGNRAAGRTIGIAGALLTLLVSIGIVAQFDRGEGSMQMVDHVDWVQSIGLSWDLGVDGISIWLVLMTTVLFSLGMFAAAQRLPQRGNMFLSLLLLSEVGLLGLFTAGDLVLFYVFWEFMLIPFAFLIWTWGGDERRRAGITFVVYTMVGSLIMLVAIISTAMIAQDHIGHLSFLISDLQGVPFSSTASTLSQ
jgi:NADH-quinone oxidoreductase subunit M